MVHHSVAFSYSQKLSSCLQVSVAGEAERSDPVQSRYADFNFTIFFLLKRRFAVVHEENTSCVYQHLGLFRICNNHPGIQGIHQHQSKYSSKVSSVLCCAELLYSMQGHE